MGTKRDLTDRFLRSIKPAPAGKHLKSLEGGNLHLGAPFEGRTEAEIHDLKRQISMYESILEKRHANRDLKARSAQRT